MFERGTQHHDYGCGYGLFAMKYNKLAKNISNNTTWNNLFFMLLMNLLLVTMYLNSGKTFKP